METRLFKNIKLYSVARSLSFADATFWKNYAKYEKKFYAKYSANAKLCRFLGNFYNCLPIFAKFSNIWAFFGQIILNFLSHICKIFINYWNFHKLCADFPPIGPHSGEKHIKFARSAKKFSNFIKFSQK